MKQQLDDIVTKLAPTIAFIKRYLAFMIVIGFLGVYLFLTYQINVLSSREPSDTDISDVVKATARPKVDPQTVDKIQQLQDQHVEVKSLFDQARNNPFSE